MDVAKALLGLERGLQGILKTLVNATDHPNLNEFSSQVW